MADDIVAVDVGGTFTDICVLSRDSGELRVAKVPSTSDPIEGVLAGVREAEVDLDGVALFSHGTTVATNALLTRRFPPAAMVTTKGFRDVIEIRRGTRDDLWDAYADVAPPPIPRRRRFEVAERTDYAGNVLEELDEDGARELAKLLERHEVETIAVCFINSFANPKNERRMAEILEEELPDVRVSTSSEVVPEIFEHERFSTTIANAVLQPLVGRYVTELNNELKEGGYDGDLLILHSGGGVMTPETADRWAVRLAGSGIAAGAIASRHIAGLCDFENAIGLDMGGTSTDISLVYEGEARTTNEWSVQYGYPILFPSIEVLTIGAGGGSLAWLDDAGSLRNGPQSAGADPGPACYGQGGDEATNTDANVVLGRLGNELIAGAMTLDEEAAASAVRERVAEPLGLSVEDAAEAVLEVANANMADAIRLISVRRGYDPREFALVCFGGAGPLHGAALARELSIPTVLVPPNPGTTSALGLPAGGRAPRPVHAPARNRGRRRPGRRRGGVRRARGGGRRTHAGGGSARGPGRAPADDRHALCGPVALHRRAGGGLGQVARRPGRDLRGRARAGAQLPARGQPDRGVPAQPPSGRRDPEGRAPDPRRRWQPARARPARERCASRVARRPWRRRSTGAPTSRPAHRSRDRRSSSSSTPRRWFRPGWRRRSTSTATSA